MAFASNYNCAKLFQISLSFMEKQGFLVLNFLKVYQDKNRAEVKSQTNL